MMIALLLGSLVSGIVLADDVASVEAISGNAEIGIGYEAESMGTKVPATYDESAPTQASDASRGGVRLTGQFGGINLDVFKANPGKMKVRFLPFQPSFDVSNVDAYSDFGRVKQLAKDGSFVRRFYGIVVEGVYTPTDNGTFFVRARLGSVEYDRDRGLWDWRILDTALAMKGKTDLQDGYGRVSFEVAGGAAAGYLKLINFEKVQEALNIERVMHSTPTLSPYIGGTAAWDSDSRVFRVEVSSTVEKRFDLRFRDSRGTYLGREVSPTSESVTSALTASMKLPFKGKVKDKCSAFIRVEHKYDNLTLSHTLLGTGDGFQSLTGIGGMNCKF